MCMKKIIFVLVSAFVLNILLDPGMLPAQTPSKENIFGGISDFISNKDAFDAIQEIKRQVKKDPKNKTLYLALAAYYNETGMIKEEIKVLREVLKFLPETDEDLGAVYSGLAFAYMSQDKWDQAKNPVEKALAINPQDNSALVVNLCFLMHERNFPKAAEALEKIQQITPENDGYHDFYLYLLEEKYPDEDILQVFEEGIKANPKSPFARRMIASALRAHAGGTQKNLPRIISEFKKAIKLKPDYIPTYISFANTYLFLARETKDKSHYQSALKWMKKAKKIDPQFVRIYYNYGFLYSMMGEYDKAIDSYEKCVFMGLEGKELYQGLAEAYNNKAYDCYKTGQCLNEGLKRIDQAIAINHFDAHFLSTKAELLYKMGRFDEAYRYIQQAIAINPDAEEIKQDLINIETALKKTKLPQDF